VAEPGGCAGSVTRRRGRRLTERRFTAGGGDRVRVVGEDYRGGREGGGRAVDVTGGGGADEEEDG
jgi:hypothetical protein